MSELNTLRAGFVAFIDGLWWGLRDNVGALSMYEGYAGGFRQIGREIAQDSNGKGVKDAAKVAADIMAAMGLDAEAKNSEIIVRKCPYTERILERGLEYAFHIEEICWKPLLEGIGEHFEVSPSMISSLRLNHVEKAKGEYKKSKAKKALDADKISEKEYKKTLEELDKKISNIPEFGRYQYK